MTTAASSSTSARSSHVSTYVYLTQVLAFCLCWSAAFPLAKAGLRDAPVFTFLCIRFLIAAALMLGWLAWRGGARNAQASLKALGLVAVIGLCNNALYLGFTWVGMTRVSSGLTSVIISTNPVWTVLAASLMLGERMTWRRGAGLALCVAGVLWIVWRRIDGLHDSLAGVLLVALGALSLVTGTLLFKRWQPRVAQVDLLLSNAVQIGVSGLVLLPLTGWEWSTGRVVHWTPQFIWALAGIIGLVSIVAYLLWLHLLRARSATEASALHFLMPPLGLVMSWLALGEPLHGSDLLGIVPVAAGIWLVTRESSGTAGRSRSG